MAPTACSGDAAPRDQWLVTVATDAPVPQLGDRLLVEVLDEDGDVCSACERIFGVAEPDVWPLSFAILPSEEGGEVRLRARLYRAIDGGASGRPSSSNIIDTAGRLPPTTGVTQVAVELRMACFGVVAEPDSGRTCQPSTGQPGPMPTLLTVPDAGALPSVGSWPQAEPIPCPTEPPADMRCVPGGVFLLGSPAGSPLSLDLGARPEHLVQLSPFFLDVDELTVGRMKALVTEHGLPEPIGPSGPATGPQAMCTYDASSGANDDKPLNCITLDLARQACEAQGKRLPSEAEWEYAAGNLQGETSYPWGSDEQVCEHAVVARGRFATDNPEVLVCREDGTIDAGPVAGGHPGDVTLLGLRNMAGSVAEFTADAFSPYDSLCWSELDGLAVDPVCGQGLAGFQVVRGAHWASPTFQAKVFERDATSLDGENPYNGVRCARDP
jgi:formylglycine-generating enzyme required for sulfatase activity